ncbi:sulfotransferase [Myxococcota bacterium]
MRITPIFILSLPRSGSTLLQRILSTHPAISTTPETWVLLPQLYSRKKYGIQADYNHSWCKAANDEFFNVIGESSYLEELRAFYLGLYEKASEKESLYFVDKTPRYSLIVNELFTLFPDAKFIFLWRNPIDILSSISANWYEDKWVFFNHYVDIWTGLKNLTDAYEKHQAMSISVQFERLVQQPDATMEELCAYLQIRKEDINYQSIPSTNVEGLMGDKRGIEQNKINTELPFRSSEKIDNIFRFFWAKAYLRMISKRRLEVMDYDYNSIDNMIILKNIGLFKTAKDILGGGLLRIKRTVMFRLQRLLSSIKGSS